MIALVASKSMTAYALYDVRPAGAPYRDGTYAGRMTADLPLVKSADRMGLTGNRSADGVFMDGGSIWRIDQSAADAAIALNTSRIAADNARREQNAIESDDYDRHSATVDRMMTLNGRTY